jgi:hypothetical protein
MLALPNKNSDNLLWKITNFSFYFTIYNIKSILCKYLISKEEIYLFIFGALMDRVLNWQTNHED